VARPDGEAVADFNDPLSALLTRSVRERAIARATQGPVLARSRETIMKSFPGLRTTYLRANALRQLDDRDIVRLIGNMQIADKTDLHDWVRDGTSAKDKFIRETIRPPASTTYLTANALRQLDDLDLVRHIKDMPSAERTALREWVKDSTLAKDKLIRRPPASTAFLRANALRQLDRRGILIEVLRMSEVDRTALKAWVQGGSTQDRLISDTISYVDSPWALPSTQGIGDATLDKPGEKSFDANVSGGTVEVHLNPKFVDAKVTRGGTGNSFSMCYTGAESGDTHWLQFAWSEILVTRNGVSAAHDALVTASGKSYRLTTNPAAPNHILDDSNSDGIFYDVTGSHIRTDRSVTMLDAPSGQKAYCQRLLTSSPAPSAITSRIHFTTYLVRRTEVLYKVKVSVEWKYVPTDDDPVADAKVTHKKGVSQLDGAHRELLNNRPFHTVHPVAAPVAVGPAGAPPAAAAAVPAAAPPAAAPPAAPAVPPGAPYLR
jgi:hypothetical protein